MSTSTWTTTTSATGLPTLEPQPVIKRRATSFRGIQDFSPSHSPTRLNQEEPRNYHLSQRGANRYNLNERGVNPPYLRSPTKSSDSLGNAKVSDFNTDFKRNRTGKIFRRNTFLTQLKEDSVEGGKAPEKELRRNSYDESRAARSSNINLISRSSQPKDISESRNFKENILSSSRQSKLSAVNTSSDSENADPSTATTEDRVKKSVLPQNKTDTEDVSISDRLIQNKSPTSNKSTQKRDHQVVLLGDKVESSLLPSEPEASSELVKDEWDSETIFTLDDGTVYNLDHLSDNHLLNTLSDWDYPIFDLAESSGPNLLSHLSYRVFYEIGLFQTFKLPLREFLNFFHNLEMGYRDIPYHNQIHAADVLHAVYYFTTQPIPGFSPPPEAALAALQHAVLGKGKFLLKPSPMARFLGVYQFPCVPVPRTRGYIFENLLRKLREGGSVSQNPCRIFHCQESYGILGENIPALELMALYTASAMHDYDHPGRTNAFLVTTNAPQAVLYNDRSVLENHHAASAWSLFLSKPEFNFLVHLGKAEFKRFRYLVIEFILATDLKRHFELIAEFNAKANELSGPGIDWNSESDRLLVLQMTIKLSDINGPCKESELHRSWTNRIAEEFYDQGEEEKKLGLPVSPYMDRSNPQLPKLQESFINHLVAPLCNAYSEAGLLPGMWQEGSTVESIKEESDSNDEDDESSGSEEVVQKAKFKLKKIICQLPRHIEENHQYWVNKIKEEHLHSDEVSPQQLSPQDDAVLFQKTENLPPSFPEDQSDLVTQFTSECVMESIDEEKTPAGVSNSPSFSFVSSDTVQKVTSQIVKASGALMICLRENVRRGHILSKNVVPELEV